MDGGSARRQRTCIRCGRTGSNAFRPVSPADDRAWACTHLDTCAARARLRRRGLARLTDGRPATSSIAPADLTEKTACVIGTDDAAVARVAQLVELTIGVEVDRLRLTHRAIDRVWRRDYGLVLYDATPSDSVALMNQLARGLAACRRQGTMVIVCHDVDALGPALERLTQEVDAVPLAKPIRPMALLRAANLSEAPIGVLAG